ncbi:MAG: CMP/dCMP deaminase zinc-binding protein [candidate division TM6 bacterium GW2011_GWF2_37_49]|nr:MAG: CMP/dCMP deaminase zinc-binding protein [candidate division TM6 bacterium GW2011_GWF2_37_49]
MKNNTKQKNKSIFYMKKALLQAKVAFKNNEVPIGAIIIDSDGHILSRAYNKIEKSGCQAAHAEMISIKRACEKKGDWRLNGCTLYVTLEPCLMCLGLIQLSRLDKVVFGAESPLFGTGILKGQADSLAKTYAKNLKIEGGVCVDECAKLLQFFFSNQRKKKGG